MKLPFENDRSDQLRGKIVQYWLITAWIVVPILAVLDALLPKLRELFQHF